MRKRKLATMVIIIVMIFASSLLAENNKFGISFTAGYSIIKIRKPPALPEDS